MVPDRVIHAEADKPAEQKVEFQPLHQLALGADAVKGLQQHRRSSFSGAIEGGQNPCKVSRRPSNRSLSAAFAISRIVRSG